MVKKKKGEVGAPELLINSEEDWINLKNKKGKQLIIHKHDFESLNFESPILNPQILNTQILNPHDYEYPNFEYPRDLYHDS